MRENWGKCKKVREGHKGKKVQKEHLLLLLLLLFIIIIIIIIIIICCAHPNFCTAKKPKILKQVEKPSETLALQATTCSSYYVTELIPGYSKLTNTKTECEQLDYCLPDGNHVVLRVFAFVIT